MFCNNCGNRLEENTIVCTNCGSVVGRSNYKKKNQNNIKSIGCLILGIISVLMCFSFLLKDISDVKTCINIDKKIYYALELVIVPLIVSFITLIVSYSGNDRNRSFNKIGLFLAIISLFMIAAEIVIVIVY